MEPNKNWFETKQRFCAWWYKGTTDRPLMWIAVKNDKSNESPVKKRKEFFRTPEDQFTDANKIIDLYRDFLKNHIFMAEGFSNCGLSLGAGSMALYLGSEPDFAWDTLWFEPCINDDWKDFGDLTYNDQNRWWKKHLSMHEDAKTSSRGEFPVAIPDIVENLDILASLRGTQNLLYDIADRPDIVKKYVDRIDELYFEFYDRLYEIVKLDDESSIYTVFQIWGPGRTAKVQCDFCAMISPEQFRELVLPSLRKQCQTLDNSLYHLDGPDAIKHLDALLEIDHLDAIQWTPGAGRPDAGNEAWFYLYDKIVEAGKSLHIFISDGGFDMWLEKTKKLKKRYDNRYLYLIYPVMSEREAEELIKEAGK